MKTKTFIIKALKLIAINLFLSSNCYDSSNKKMTLKQIA